MTDATQLPAFDLMEWREAFIRTILRLASVFGIVILSIAFPTATATDRVLFVILYLALAVITIFPTPYLLRAYLLLFMTTAVGINALLAWGPWADGNLFLLAAVILASLLLDSRTDIIVVGVSIFIIAAIGFFALGGAYSPTAARAPAASLIDWGAYLANFTVIGIMLVTAANLLKRAYAGSAQQMQSAYRSLSAERQAIEKEIQERSRELELNTYQLRAATSTARSIAETQDITSLLAKAADLIAERFEYYHVGVFILDEQRRTAYLQASSSEMGKNLTGQAFRIDADRRNPLTRVIENRQAIIFSGADKNTLSQDVNFPLTRSRMTIPLAVRGSLIGILDIHSDQPFAFKQEDAEILQTLADLTAISFDNVRLLEETRSLLSQLETGSAFQTQKTWSKFTSRQKNAYLYTPAGVRPVFSRISSDKDREGSSIPIMLQGQKIGRIKLKRKGSSGQWSERELDLIEKIATQVALALENSRLVDEAQKNAHRNQMIANFSTFVRETLDVESVVLSAATELRKVFELKEAEVLIGLSQKDTPAQSPINWSGSSE